MIYSLETLRGLAALIVAFYHFPGESIFFIKQGFMAVYFFFSLSGFVIALNYFNKINNFKNLIYFQKKRFFRLYPIHIIVLFIVLGIQCLKYILIKLGLPAGSEAFGGSPATGSWYTLKDFILQIFLLQAVIEYGYFLSWNGAAWTISAEFYTYFIFGLLVLITFRKLYIYIIISILYILFHNEIFEFINSFFKIKLHYLLKDCLLFFLTGSLMYFVYEKIKFRLNDIIFLILLFMILFFQKYLTNYLLFSVILIFVALLKNDSFINKLLNNKSLVYMGTISYSFYMIHQVVLYCLIQVLKIFNLGYSFSSEISGSTGSIFFDSMITIIYIIISILVAIVMNKYIENKLRIR